jgi:hypothetical protein
VIWVYFFAMTIADVMFIVAMVQDNTQHMIWWGFISLMNLVAWKFEERK